MYKDFQQVLDKVKGGTPCTISVAVAQDENVLEAVKLAAKYELANAILVGDAERITPLLKACGMPETIPVIHEPDIEKATATAVALVKEGRAQVLMKGLVNTSVFLKAVLKSETGLRTGRTLSHLSAFEIPGEAKLLFVTDVGLNTYPNVEEKKEILWNAMQVLNEIGFVHPNVAILAANEAVSDKMPATVDAQALVEMSKSGIFPPGTIEGPLALDVIAREEAAKHKGIHSKVSGRTDLVLVSNIEAGNAIAKSLTHYAKAKMAGIVIGASNPIVLTSRSETAEGKLLSIALARLAFEGSK